MDAKDVESLVVRFLNGEISENEQAELFRLVSSDEDVRKTYFSLSEKWMKNYRENDEERIHREVACKKVVRKIKGGSYRRFNYWKPGVAVIAASVFLALVLGYYVGSSSLKSIFAERIVSQNDSTEILVPKGSRVKIVLADGSVAWINAGSRLSFNKNFSNKNRNLYLKGEAYFEVAKRKEAPFKVYTDKVCITAKGTAFNVESYTNNVKTTLANGIVIVSDKSGDERTLKPNQSVLYDAGTRKFDKIQNVNTELYTSWKDDLWIIRSMEMTEFIERLEKRYDVEIIVEDSTINNRRISATLSNETIEQILLALKSSMGLEYSIHKNVIKLKQIKDKIQPK